MLIHQVWIGSKSPPMIWMQSIQSFCQTYNHTYMLWTNDEIKTLRLKSYPGLEELFIYYASLEIPEKYLAIATLISYVILYERGGVYLDTDCVIIKPNQFQDFLHSHAKQLVAGYQTPEATVLGTGVILCPQYNRTMKEILDTVSKYAYSHRYTPILDQIGSTFLTNYYKSIERYYPDEIYIAPSTYFYPMDIQPIDNVDIHKQLIFPTETMIFQYRYVQNNLEKKVILKQTEKPTSTNHMYIILLALGALYILQHITKTS